MHIAFICIEYVGYGKYLIHAIGIVCPKRSHAPQITTIVNQASVISYNWQQKFWLSALIIAANI